MHLDMPFQKSKKTSTSDTKSKYSILPQHNPKRSTHHRVHRSRAPSFSDYIRFILGTITLLILMTPVYWHSKIFPSSTGYDSSVSRSPTVNLIIADHSSSSPPSDDLTSIWAHDFHLPGLNVIHYPPPVSPSVGDEALAYLTYIYESYDSLPEISIFTHTDPSHPSKYLPFTTAPFSALSPTASTTPSLLSNLSLPTVLTRGYLPLCFDSPFPTTTTTTTNTTGTPQNTTLTSLYHSFSFHRNFPNSPLPPRFPTPCTQFALSRNLIRSIPRTQYHRHLLLLQRACHNSGAAQKWASMWQYLFLGHTEEILPHKNLCSGWGVCFGSRGEWEEWRGAVEQRGSRMAEVESERRLVRVEGLDLDLGEGLEELRREVGRLTERIEKGWGRAVVRGMDGDIRGKIARDLYADDVEGLVGELC